MIINALPYIQRARQALLRPLPAPGLQSQLALATLLVLGLGFFVIWLIVKAHLARELNAHQEFYGRSLARQAALAATPLVRSDDKPALGRQLDSLLKDAHVLEAVISAKDGTVLARRPLHAATHIDRPTLATPFVEAIEAGGQRLGFVRLNLNTTELASGSQSTLQRVALGALLLVLVLTLLVWHGAGVIARRLLAAEQRMSRLLGGELQPFGAAPRLQDEAGALLSATEQLRLQLQSRQHHDKQMARFAPSPLTQCLRIDDSGELAKGRYMQASLLLVEFVNLGPLSDRHTPETLAELLNTYHALLARACKLYNGQIDKYYGDGVLVLFGIPRQDEEHAFHALCAASLFQQLTQKFNETRGAENSLQVRLSLHTGGLLAAILGTEQAQFTLLGDALNLVMRLAGVAGQDEIVLSKELAELPELKPRLQTTPHRNILVKGRSEPSPSYLLSGLAAPYGDLLAGQVQHLIQQINAPTA